ncbi:hypothetical protein CH373_05995 [Leptospira perolatii]|uniref:Uncharacterized protein n=1 Tax=Leptospira perolatii TaxID=2023191 RepID=A0A2M9ZNY7_9LEPT|nr:hypothetical protein [Leptospira perolatii]PJZ70819.1 hypothetical protein CH360_04725 [Leptospira perolatii]PJZ73715.1 hypothetical protein CH373_05995 [Leptospira perolatii]
MTIAIAWIREVKKCQELIICTDSRLNGGMRWDQGPKLFTLPRSDSAICFAGDTSYAYPLIIQLTNAISQYDKSSDRSLDIHKLRGHIIKVCNSLKDSIRSLSDKNAFKDNEFLFGGYSWTKKNFFLWKIRYDRDNNKFHFIRNTRKYGKLGKILFAGDMTNTAKKSLGILIKQKYGSSIKKLKGIGYDFEPFEVIRDMLRASDLRGSIGGAPQILKVYQHMNSRVFGVYWPNKDSKKITINGRELIGYENIQNWIIDPDTLVSEKFTKTSYTEEDDEEEDFSDDDELGDL